MIAWMDLFGLGYVLAPYGMWKHPALRLRTWGSQSANSKFVPTGSV